MMKIKQTLFMTSLAILMVTMSCGDDDPTNLAPEALFTIGGTAPYYLDVEVPFTDNSTDDDGTVASWFWDFGDNTTSTEQNPTHAYSSKASYTVSLTVTDNAGSSSTTTNTINIQDINDENEAPVAGFTVADTLVLNGSDVVFTSTSTDAEESITAYDWSFGDGTGTSSDENPTYSFSLAGNYEVSLTVTDVLGKEDTYMKNIFVAGISWSFPVGLKVESTAPAIGDDGTVFVTLSGKEGVANIHALTSDGAEIWQKEVGDIVRASPVISNDGATIYVASYDDHMYALNAATGATNWMFDIGSNAKYSTSALGTDGSLYGGYQTDNVHALNGDGTEKWVFPTSGDVNGSAAIGTDGTVYIHSIDDFLYALDPTDGTKKWDYFYGNWSGTALALTAEGNIIVTGEKDSETGVVAAVTSAGTELWSVNTTIVSGSASTSGKIDQGGPAIGPDGTIYVGTKGPELLALDPASGATKWSYTKPEFAGVGSTPAIDNRGFIYFGDDSGIFTVLDPEGNLVFEMSLGVKIWASATIGDDGTVYIGATQEDDTGVFYAINFHANGPADSSWPMRHGNRYHNGRL
ncbi:MAG: outer membrane protein assembly factor BamB [Cyclobacteriaceae bacterium]|jgi:outer membrane protein assembly factor BamB